MIYSIDPSSVNTLLLTTRAMTRGATVKPGSAKVFSNHQAFLSVVTIVDSD